MIIFASSILSCFVWASSEKFDSSNSLGELWQKEEIYFQPKNKADVLDWTGTLYQYESKKCFEIYQKEISSKVSSKEVKCDSAFLKKAVEPYAKIADFKKYESRILECLSTNEQKCLRGLISKTLQVSFGVDGLQDRRDYIFENWKKEDFKRLGDSIKKGVTDEGDNRTFPPEVSDGGMGYRGQFTKQNGGWLLKSFIAGD